MDAGGGVYPMFAMFPFVFQPNPSAAAARTRLPGRQGLLSRASIPPAGLPQTPVDGQSVSNSLNRSEPVAFLEAGKYLVICNVRPHLVDGMYAYVKVSH